MTTRLKWRKEGANVAILGATGAVGREMLHCVEVLGLPVASLALLASARSAGMRSIFAASISFSVVRARR